MTKANALLGSLLAENQRFPQQIALGQLVGLSDIYRSSTPTASAW